MARGSWLLRGSVILLLLGLSVLPTAAGATGSLYIDGEPVVFSATVLSDEGEVEVPIGELAPLLGAEWTEDGAGGGRLHWDGGLLSVDAASLTQHEGVLFVLPEEASSWVGGAVHRIGDEIHVDVSPATLDDVLLSGDAFVLRFSGFAPERIVSVDESTIALRFDNCGLSITPRTIILPSGTLESVQIARDGAACRVTFRLHSPGQLQLWRFHSQTYYGVTVAVGEVASRETTSVVDDTLTIRELETAIEGTPATSVIATVRDWRQIFRLAPVLAPDDVEASEVIDARLDRAGGIAAIGWSPSDGLLVVDGIPRRNAAGEEWALGMDLFGRLSAFQPAVEIALRVPGQSAPVPVTDINRPIAYDELVVYSPGYVGTISPGGIPGTFVVVKLRDNRVVSIYRGGFTIADPSATVLVASGESKAFLAGISLGDRVRIEYSLDAYGRDYRHAVRIDEVLAADGAWRASTGDQSSTTWSILAQDWLGALSFVMVQADGEGSLSETAVADYIGGLLEPLKDVWVLSQSETAALAIRSGGYSCRFGAGSPVSIALCLALSR